MKRIMTIILVAVAAFAFTVLESRAQEPPKPPTIEEMAAKEAERLERLLELEYWQVFYVDSTLQHDFKGMQKELEGYQKAKVSNPSMYVAVQDRWMEKIDSTYKVVFTPVQWKTYLKMGGAKEQKARARRKAKSESK